LLGRRVGLLLLLKDVLPFVIVIESRVRHRLCRCIMVLRNVEIG